MQIKKESGTYGKKNTACQNLPISLRKKGEPLGSPFLLCKKSSAAFFQDNRDNNYQSDNYRNRNSNLRNQEIKDRWYNHIKQKHTKFSFSFIFKIRIK
jgi:hypothetical protein